MTVPFVDLKVQYLSIKTEIDSAVAETINAAAFVGGRQVEQFENDFARFLGVKHCVGVGNGTDAIHIVLRALGIGNGDEVITVANSFIATSEAITLAGARVVFVDCDPKTYNLDTDKLAKAIGPKTKAIVPVHLYGQPADMVKVRQLASQHGLFVVEDAAQAHAAELDGRRVGSFGDAAAFSFYPGKNLGAYGDGGAIATDDEKLAERCRMLANHGRTQKYDHAMEGVNSRLDGIQAAVLRVKLKHLDQWTNNRRAVAAKYRELLADSPVITPVEMENVKHVYHLFVVRLKNRDMVQKALLEHGINTGIHYPIALPNLQAYRYLGHSPSDFPVATRYSGEILSLPMYPELSESQVEYTCEKLKKVAC
jgi:dTDP-4-amino-4,6-dideoxygalactose transaminase